MENSEYAGRNTIDDLERLSAILESMKKDSESKNNLLKIISHDLMSPATSIAGLVKLLLKPETVANFTDKQLNIVQTVDRAMNQYMETLFNIMELSRILRNTACLKKENVECQALIDTSVEKVKQKAAAKGIVINSDYHGTETVFTDREKARQTLDRLLSNAVMFTQTGGVVEVFCQEDGGHMILEVRDNGVGIEKERLDRIFDIDEKTKTFGTCDEKGSGMGLCIAERTARLCGGGLVLQSEPGHGTVARLRLPKRDEIIDK